MWDYQSGIYNGTPLTRRQADALEVLMRRRGSWVASERLMGAVFGHLERSPVALRVLIHSLRKKGVPIESRWGYGYRVP